MDNFNIKKDRKIYGWFAIYALIDPETHEIFYVGRSKNPKVRTGQHFNEAKDNKPENWFAYLWGLEELSASKKSASNPQKIKRINDILTAGQTPIVKILDEWYCEKLADANRLEDAWIAEMIQQGHPLTNFILSHRMSPKWYSPKRRGWRPGWSSSPMEYISALKSNHPEFQQEQYNNQPVKKTRKKKKSNKWDSRVWSKN